MGRTQIDDSLLATQSGVTPGSYNNTNLTVNSKGIITAASTGSSTGFSSSVVVTTQNITTATGTNSYTLTSLTGNFSVSVATHGVKISVSGDMEVTSANDYGAISIFRDGVDLFASASSVGGVGIIYGGFGETNLGSPTAVYIDRPGNTNAHTYDIRVKSFHGVSTVTFPTGNCVSIMTLEEVV